MHVDDIDNDKMTMTMMSKHDKTMQTVNANNESEMTAANDDVDD